MICQAVAGISDEYVAEAAEYKAKSRVSRKTARWLTAAASVLLAFGLGIFSVWFFTPSDMWGASTNALQLTVVRVDDKMASYAFVDMSPYEETVIESCRGELYRRHGDVSFYRIKGANDLARLIFEQDEDLWLIEFDSWIQPMSSERWKTSYWYTGGYFTDEDIAALDADAKITYADTLGIIYGVESAEDIISVKFEDADIDKTDIGDSVKIKAVTLRDSESAQRMYTLLCTLVDRDGNGWNGWVRVFADDEEYKNGTMPLSEQTEREVVVTLASGRKLKFNYSPTSSIIKKYGDGFGAELSEEDNEWLISVAEIDMQYHYYGDAKNNNAGNTAPENNAVTAVPSPAK